MGASYTNRGRKLKRDAREVYQGKLTLGPTEGHGVKVVRMGNKKQAVVYKKRKLEDIHPEDATYDDSDGDSDPYEDIKLGDLLTPISHPTELPKHPAISRTYKSEAIRKLSKRALDIICEEQKHAVQFSKLMSVFLGDDPSYARSEKMSLPIYEHLGQDDVLNGNMIEDASTAGVKGEAEDNDRRVTRKQVSQEMDPFFALPQINIDRDFGLSKETAEESRQLAQIALQRSEEFIRCMTNVRMGLLRAERRKDMVYSWCDEMSTQQEQAQAAIAVQAQAAAQAANNPAVNEPSPSVEPEFSRSNGTA